MSLAYEELGGRRDPQPNEAELLRLQAERDVAHERYKQSKGSGNSRAETHRRHRAWVLATAKLAAAEMMG